MYTSTLQMIIEQGSVYCTQCAQTHTVQIHTVCTISISLIEMI